jgi:serine/threonine protein kinase
MSDDQSTLDPTPDPSGGAEGKDFIPPASSPARMPKQIGKFRIKKLIATGGMGAVYQGVQEQPRRTVAIKLMKSGVTSKSALRRFEYESQLLARLKHPGIAAVYDAGTHEAHDGAVPYFVMEYIAGAKRITDYVRDKNLSTRERLKLFTEAADAIHHGHTKGIIHRDLKPDNVLVDSFGKVKVIDFGVARATDSDMAVTTLQTDIGQLIGTVQYMSPEQVEAEPDNLDTRSDVYSLGVILYEMLCGKLPYDVSKMKLYDATRVVREQEALKLSTVDTALRGDVETIVAKALEKDRDRRYQSAENLAADIQRYLHDEPITARPPSLTYQVRVFTRRNKALMTGVAAVFGALLLGLAGMSYLYVDTNLARRDAETARASEAAQRQLAEENAASVQAVSDFLLTQILDAADPETGADSNIKLIDALDQASANIGDQFIGIPLVEASIRFKLGRIYRQIGEYTIALSHLERSLHLYQTNLGEESLKTLEIIPEIRWVHFNQGQYDKNLPLLHHWLPIARHALGEHHHITIDLIRSLGWHHVNKGEYRQAHNLFEEANRLITSNNNPDPFLQWWVNSGLAWSHFYMGRYTQSEGMFRENLILSTSMYPTYPEHSLILKTKAWLGMNLTRQRKLTEARGLLENSTAVLERNLGLKSFNTLQGLNELGYCYLLEGRLQEAEDTLTRSRAGCEQSLGLENEETLDCLGYLAEVYAAQGRHDEAIALHESTLATRRRFLGAGHHDILDSMHWLARVYHAAGREDEARKLFDEAYAFHKKDLGDEHPKTREMTEELTTLFNQSAP